MRKNETTMKKLKNLLFRIYHIPSLKYIVVVVAAVVLVGFVDENSVWKHMRNQQYIGELEDEIAKYHQQFRQDQAQIHLLESNPKAMEKIARERYFMKTDDEDIFVLSDDVPTEKTVSDETTE